MGYKEKQGTNINIKIERTFKESFQSSLDSGTKNEQLRRYTRFIKVDQIRHSLMSISQT